MPFELFVALRFLREGRAQTVLILAGASVGVAVIVFLSALIDGLQASLVAKTLGSQPHIIVRAPEEVARPLTRSPESLLQVVRPAQRLRSVDQWQQVRELLERTPGVEAVAPVVSGPGFAARGTASRSVAIRGVEPEPFSQVIDVPSRLVAGAWRLRGSEAVIGQELAKDLGLEVGDKLRLSTAEGRSDTFLITGIFDLGNKDVNGRWVLVPLRSGQTLLDLMGGVSSLELKVTDLFGAEGLADELQRRTGLVAESWMTLNAQLLTALRSQSSSRYMIQFFVIVAVALGIASVLVVSVVQKSREIGILKAMGTATSKVMRVFLIQGAVVGVVGSVLGSAMGSGLALFFTAIARNPDGSPLFPITLEPGLFLTAAGVALVTGLVAAVVPARRASRLDPAVVIRNG
ncbi:ABC transporter permease [Hyalangium minutum]|uniref:Lipoprotein releasing system transmembrane protein LolC n=1 Tax=Hyalangium minutum TaxID=394096 RepID=A0A085W715_9BACT|nr:ABC transporter permease [Hyalangium minutum]KFE63478.1 Lipoprotein releasing system transmembrane protein LolC [Hyalangium minutum]